MILLSFFAMVFLTSFTGSVIFALWKFVSIGLEWCGEIKLVSSLLHVVIMFHLVPVVFAWLLYWSGAFLEGKVGNLLTVTPLLLETVKGLAFIWLVGFSVEVFRYLRQQKVQRVEERISNPAGARSKEMVRRIRERLHITEEIPVYELSICNSPFITGVFKPRIFIPKTIEKEREMEVILEHELFHYLHGDLHLKKFCCWVVRLQWFNPFAHLLVRAVDSWGDSLCDYHICYESSDRWDIHEYFDVVIQYAQNRGEHDFGGRMWLARGKRQIHRRIKRMKRLKTDRGMKNGLRRAWVSVLTICFILASSFTAMAAGEGMTNLYGSAYVSSMTRSQESGEDDLEEFTRGRSEELSIVDTDEEVNLDSRGLNTYTWNLAPGDIYETGIFWASKGDKIGVGVTPSPATSKIGFGLDQPDGYLRGVTTTGASGHTFTVTVTGFHRVYAENPGSRSITVAVSVSKD